jgi:hypothetical protein
LLAQRDVAVIVAEWSQAWQKWIAAHAPAPIFVHCGLPADNAILPIAARGIDVRIGIAIADVDAILQELQASHALTSRPTQMTGAEVDFGDATGMGELIECSSDGMAFRLPTGFPLRGVGRDRILSGVQVWNGNDRVLGPIDAEVLSIGRDTHGYRIDCAWVAAAPIARGNGGVISERTRIAALVLGGLQRTGVALHQPGSPLTVCTIREGEVDFGTFELTATATDNALRPLDIVEGGFDLNHTRYEFTSVVRDVQPLRIRLPNTLACYEHRETGRQSWTEEATLRLLHPLNGQPLALSIRDVSPEGVGVALDCDMPPFPRTLQIRQVTLEFGAQRFRARAQVRRVDRREAKARRIGLRLEFATAEEQARFAQFQTQAAFPMVEESATESFDTLFSFVDRAGGIPAGVSAESVRPTFERLHDAPSSLCRTLVVRDGSDIVAHCCAMKRYVHTWTMQHVTSTTGDGHTALAVSRAILELCQHDPAMRFVHTNYAATNPFSSRTIGSALSGIPGAGRWSLAPRAYSTIEGVPVVPRPRHVSIRTARSFADLVAAERIISESESPLLLEANDWQAASLPMQELEGDYERHGLTRTRHLLLAEIGGEAVGFALAEVSSVGMNVREDFSAGRLWVARATSGRTDAVRHALLQALGELYVAYGRSTWHLIADRDQEPLLASIAAHPPVRFVEATVRRDAVAQLSVIWAQMSRTPTPANPASKARAA